MRTVSSALLTILAGVMFMASADVSLTARGADYRDDVWKARGLIGEDCYGIEGNHVPGTNGDVIWNSFPGTSGNYKVELRAVLEPDGDSPYKFYINGSQKASGNYPYSTGTRDCESSYYEVRMLNLGEHQVNQGDEIKYWASSVYPCGTSHGQYSRFTLIRFTLLDVPDDETPPSVPGNVHSTATTNTTIDIAWNAASDAESGISAYRVYIGTSMELEVAGSVTSATLNGLLRDTEYSGIAVSAVNGRQLESTKSSPITVRTANESAPSGTMFIKASDGALADGMSIMSGVGGALSQNPIYGVTGNTSSPQAGDSKATYTIDIPTSGTWYAWGRFMFESDGYNNSFWIVVDGGSAQRFGNGEHALGSWHWEGYMDQGHIDLGTLSAGEHTITVYSREPSEQSMLDILCLTSSSSYVPSDADVDFTVLAPLTLMSPSGGEAYEVGQVMTIEWSAIQTQVTEVEILLSTDEGETWTVITPTAIGTSDPEWGSFDYTVLAGDVSTMCLVQVRDYNNKTTLVQSTSTFTVNSTAVSTGPLSGSAGHRQAFAIAPATGALTVSLGTSGSFRLRVTDMQGHAVMQTQGVAPTTVAVPRVLTSGVYFVTLESAALTETRTVRILK